MPKWDIHKKWDSKVGVSPEVSDYIVKAIDSKGPSDKKIRMPEDFRRHTLDRKIPLAKRSNISIADMYSDLHDRAKSRFVQEEDLRFLLKKGEEYIKAYYLHHVLDYLDHSSIRDWIKVTGSSVEDCIGKYVKNMSVSILETQETLAEVIDFLKGHAQELKRDLSL